MFFLWILWVVLENSFWTFFHFFFLQFGIFQTNFISMKFSWHENMVVIGIYQQKIKSVVFVETYIWLFKLDKFWQGCTQIVLVKWLSSPWFNFICWQRKKTSNHRASFFNFPYKNCNFFFFWLPSIFNLKKIYIYKSPKLPQPHHQAFMDFHSS